MKITLDYFGDYIQSGEMKKLPSQLHGAHRGNHDRAIKLAHGISRHLSRSIEAMENAKNQDLSAIIRGANLLEADHIFNTIKLHVTVIQEQLRIAYCDR